MKTKMMTAFFILSLASIPNLQAGQSPVSIGFKIHASGETHQAGLGQSPTVRLGELNSVGIQYANPQCKEGSLVRVIKSAKQNLPSMEAVQEK